MEYHSVNGLFNTEFSGDLHLFSYNLLMSSALFSLISGPLPLTHLLPWVYDTYPILILLSTLPLHSILSDFISICPTLSYCILSYLLSSHPTLDCYVISYPFLFALPCPVLFYLPTSNHLTDIILAYSIFRCPPHPILSQKIFLFSSLFDLIYLFSFFYLFLFLSFRRRC